MLNTRKDSQVGCTYKFTDKLELGDEGERERRCNCNCRQSKLQEKKYGRESEGISLDIWKSEDERDA